MRVLVVEAGGDVVGPGPTGDAGPPLCGLHADAEQVRDHSSGQLATELDEGAVAVDVGLHADALQTFREHRFIDGLAGGTPGEEPSLVGDPRRDAGSALVEQLSEMIIERARQLDGAGGEAEPDRVVGEEDVGDSQAGDADERLREQHHQRADHPVGHRQVLRVEDPVSKGAVGRAAALDSDDLALQEMGRSMLNEFGRAGVLEIRAAVNASRRAGRLSL